MYRITWLSTLPLVCFLLVVSIVASSVALLTLLTAVRLLPCANDGQATVTLQVMYWVYVQKRWKLEMIGLRRTGIRPQDTIGLLQWIVEHCVATNQTSLNSCHDTV